MSHATLAEPSVKLRAAHVDRLAHALRQGAFGEVESKSAIAACLMPLLAALGWRGSQRELAEALPHFADSLTIQDLRNVLATLGYATHSRRVADGSKLDPRLLPCLFLPDDGGAMVVLSKVGQHYRAFDGTHGVERAVPELLPAGRAFLVGSLDDTAAADQDGRRNWIATVFGRFRATIVRLLVLTFLLNLLSLAVPLFIMAVYDQVIPSGSSNVLGSIALGICLAFALDVAIRAVRGRMVAFMGGRVEQIVATGAFQQILALPLAMTESAPLGNQVARLREFDSLREMFTGTLITVVLELPFVVLFIAVIALLGGWLAIIPAVMMAVFGLIALLLVPALRRAVARSSAARADRHSFLVETLTNLRAIKQAGLETMWTDRYRELSASASLSHLKTSQITFLFQTLAQAVMMAAGLATIGFGVLQVLAGVMTVGGLIATMALVWRVLSPIHNLFLTLTRLEQVKVSIGQINQLMRMPVETRDRRSAGVQRRWSGRIALARVSFRYQPAAEPALLGISITAEPGEFVAITGANGSGKSTVLRLIAGLYRPQAGQVSIDGLDIRQVDPIELRQAIAYVPQTPNVFHGTIAQNLRLADPVAGDADVREACRMAGILDDIAALPDGFDTRIGDQSVWQLNAGFAQRLALARAYVKRAPVMLLDEPAQLLDERGDATFVETLGALRGQTTVIMVSHRPSHIRLADKVLVLDSGTAVMAGTPDEVFSQLPGGLV